MAIVSVVMMSGAGAGVGARKGGLVTGSLVSPNSLVFIPGIGSWWRLRAGLATLCASKRRPLR